MDEFADVAQTYDWTEQSSDDIPFYVSLARQCTGPILEVGAGTGRVTIPIAETGKTTTALDVSDAMLSRARLKWHAKGGGDHLSFELGDCRSFSMNRTFGLILVPGRTFEHALTDSERCSAFERCRNHLQPGGIVAVHVWGPPRDSDPAPPGKSRVIPAAQDHDDLRFSWREERDFLTETRKHYFVVEELGGGRRTWTHAPIEVRWYTAQALDALGHACGLTVRDRFADFHGSPYDGSSVNMVWVYTTE